MSCCLGGATAALDALGRRLRRHLHVARRYQALATAALDTDAPARVGAPHDSKGLLSLFVLLHGDELVAQLDQDLLQLLVLVPLLLVLLLEQLLALHTLLQLALRHLVVDLQDGSFVDSVLIHLRDLLHASLEELDLGLERLVILAEAGLEGAVGIFDLVELHLQLQVTFYLLLQEVVHLFALRSKFSLRGSDLLS